MSASGRVVVFESSASDLVAGDTNGQTDIFARDLRTGVTWRVSVASDGTQSNGHSSEPFISGDGRVVAFASEADNLVADDSNGRRDVFVHVLETGVTTLASRAPDGSVADAESGFPSLDYRGAVVAFESFASNLVAGDDNGTQDIFVRELASLETTRVSVWSDGTQSTAGSEGATLSDDGRFVSFSSQQPLVAGAGPGDNAYLHDRVAGSTTLVSRPTTPGSEGLSFATGLSSGGGRVIFESEATNLVPEDTGDGANVFVYERASDAVLPVEVSVSGAYSNGFSEGSAISGLGHVVVFSSDADNLVPGQDSGSVFVARARPCVASLNRRP
jgi:hypothetical protein